MSSTQVDPTATTHALAKLLRRERMRKLGAVASILLGVPLTLLLPFVLGVILWLAADASYSWWWFFGAACLIVVPLLFRFERETGGRYLDNALAGISPGGLDAERFSVLSMTAGPLVSPGTWPREGGLLFVEFLLYGPRRILAGARHLRQRWILRRVDRRRAAEALAQLLAARHGVPVSQLCEGDETVDALRPALILLACYGWIGASSDGDHVYLFTESAAALSG